jgi:hypothetical protein
MIKMTKITGKTRDGRELREIVDMLGALPGVTIKPASKHLFKATYSGEAEVGLPGACALAKSTSYERHIVPWVKKVTGLDRSAIDFAFSSGYWGEV